MNITKLYLKPRVLPVGLVRCEACCGEGTVTVPRADRTVTHLCDACSGHGRYRWKEPTK